MADLLLSFMQKGRVLQAGKEVRPAEEDLRQGGGGGDRVDDGCFGGLKCFLYRRNKQLMVAL